MTTPLGCTPCDHCETVSAVYAYYATCRECRDTICPGCASPDTWDIDEQVTALCRRCHGDKEATL